VGRQHRVVRLHHGGSQLRRRIDAEVKLALLAIVSGQVLQQKRTETRTSSTTDRLENKETLKTIALISQLADLVHAGLDEFLSDGVVTTGVVVGGVLLASDELLRVEELTVGTGADLIDDGGLQINEAASRHILSTASFVEESGEGSVLHVTFDATIRLNAMFEAVEFPAGITDLDTTLTNVNGNNFSHDEEKECCNAPPRL